MLNKEYLCVYDFDTHLYTGAKLLEDTYIIATHKETGHPLEFKNITTFKGRKQLEVGGWLGERNAARGTNLHWDDFDITNHARRNKIPVKTAKKMIKRSIEAALHKDWCRELRLVIGGKENYRKEIYPLYKAQRPPKPILYPDMRKWLEKEYAEFIVVAEGCEADDYLSIMCDWMRRECDGDFDLWDLVMLHRDKDLIQCGGYQWDWFKKLKDPIWVDEFTAAKSLWKQMLMGDTTDNIPGLEQVTPEIYKDFGFKGKKFFIGEKNSLKALEDCDTPEKMEARVVYFYQEYYGKDKWMEKFQLNFQLLRLMTRKDQIPTYNFEGGGLYGNV